MYNREGQLKASVTKMYLLKKMFLAHLFMESRVDVLCSTLSFLPQNNKKMTKTFLESAQFLLHYDLTIRCSMFLLLKREFSLRDRVDLKMKDKCK